MRAKLSINDDFVSYLQNVVVGALPDELDAIAERLAALGACRVCPPGHGAKPSMIWRHDGRPCLAELVRWCDMEGFSAWAAQPPQATPLATY